MMIFMYSPRSEEWDAKRQQRNEQSKRHASDYFEEGMSDKFGEVLIVEAVPPLEFFEHGIQGPRVLADFLADARRVEHDDAGEDYANGKQGGCEALGESHHRRQGCGGSAVRAGESAARQEERPLPFMILTVVDERLDALCNKVRDDRDNQDLVVPEIVHAHPFGCH